MVILDILNLASSQEQNAGIAEDSIDNIIVAASERLGSSYVPFAAGSITPFERCVTVSYASECSFAILGEPGVLYGEAKQQPRTRHVIPDEGTTTHHDAPLEGLPSLHPAVRTEQGGGIVHTAELVEP
ncbi:hypothetical protein TRIUR3_32643 [Triticum urartu]|uniref:Uncharacterized protein n=1 Tax=Triticum urartu TaxID=4572 RepID=M7ZYE3_TRIUA|nr:hypothetical protein TRIUR3_32643 [Triticum urartu]